MIQGVLSGFDRLVFRGSLRKIAYKFGMQGYLWANQVLLANGSHGHALSSARTTTPGQQRQDNCFPWLSNWEQAQQLMDTQLQAGWPQRLNQIAVGLNPIHDEIFGPLPHAVLRVHLSYQIRVYRSQWATDISFRQSADLKRIYPQLVYHANHAMTTFSSPDILRFLGKKLTVSADVPGHVAADSDQRPEEAAGRRADQTPLQQQLRQALR